MPENNKKSDALSHVVGDVMGQNQDPKDLLLKKKIRGIFPEKKGNVLSAMQLVPGNVHFATQNNDERVYILTRAAFITNIGWILGTILLIIFGLIVQSVLAFLNIKYDDLVTGHPLLPTTISFIYFLMVFSFSLNSFIKWFFNLYIVTDVRILDYDYAVYEKYKVSEAALVNIEDVTQKQVGVFPTIFNYGNLVIQTAAERMQFEFLKVPNPSYLRDKIMDLADLQRKNLEEENNANN